MLSEKQLTSLIIKSTATDIPYNQIQDSSYYLFDNKAVQTWIEMLQTQDESLRVERHKYISFR